MKVDTQQIDQVMSLMTPERLSRLNAVQRRELDQLIKHLETSVVREKGQENFLDFYGSVWSEFICGAHHKKMAEAFERVAQGKCNRLMINMPPRFGKSQLTSWLLPAWIVGNAPDKKIIMASHTAELSLRFGRMVRNLIDSEEYQTIFPDVGLNLDSKAAGRFDVSGGGEYFSIGVGYPIVTGKHCLIFFTIN